MYYQIISVYCLNCLASISALVTHTVGGQLQTAASFGCPKSTASKCSVNWIKLGFFSLGEEKEHFFSHFYNQVLSSLERIHLVKLWVTPQWRVSRATPLEKGFYLNWSCSFSLITLSEFLPRMTLTCSRQIAILLLGFAGCWVSCWSCRTLPLSW